MGVLGCQREAVERPGPEPIEIGAQHGQSVGVELVDATCSHGDIANEMSIFEHLQMERDRGTRDREPGCQLADRQWSVGEQVDDRAAGAVAEGRECEVCAFEKVSRH